MSQDHPDNPETPAGTEEEILQNPLAELRLGRPPFWMIATFLVLVVLSWSPLVVSARRRVSLSESPRLSLVQDMGNQPKYKAQHTSPVFADGRADRPPVIGTVARGRLEEDDHYHRGYPRGQKNEKGEVPFFTTFPQQVRLNHALLNRGRQQFNIYCLPCHGAGGYGDGPVNQRALQLPPPNQWVQAFSLHSDTTKARKDGELFNAITVGIRNMAGYGSQIQVHDRWAIVAYVRALQLSQDAPADVVPAEKLSFIK
ncbi:MAG: cytochrome c [Tepidisphaeraceae bacterium]